MTSNARPFAVRLDLKRGAVDMTHGSGGRAMAQLIEDLFVAQLDNELLRQGNDQARFDPPPGRMVMSTDGHVISPLFFPGGDIGCLAVRCISRSASSSRRGFPWPTWRGSWKAWPGRPRRRACPW